jgi:hypothetical protein
MGRCQSRLWLTGTTLIPVSYRLKRGRWPTAFAISSRVALAEPYSRLRQRFRWRRSDGRWSGLNYSESSVVGLSRDPRKRVRRTRCHAATRSCASHRRRIRPIAFPKVGTASHIRSSQSLENAVGRSIPASGSWPRMLQPFI